MHGDRGAQEKDLELEEQVMDDEVNERGVVDGCYKIGCNSRGREIKELHVWYTQAVT